MNLRLDGRKLGHLVTPWVGIFAAQRVPASPALRRLAVGARSDAIGRHQSPHPAGVPLLATPKFLRGRRGRFPLHPDWVGRGRPGAIGGILGNACLQILDLLPQFSDLPLQAVNDGRNEDTGLAREAVPDVGGIEVGRSMQTL